MELGALDRAVYQAVAATPTAHLDRPLRRLSRAADAGALWLVIAGGVAATRGAAGRRVASEAVTSLAVTAFTVNLGAKSIFRRRDPIGLGTTARPPGGCRHPARAVPIRALGNIIRLRLHHRSPPPLRRHPHTAPRRGGGLLTRAHRRALPRRRHHRLHHGCRNRRRHRLSLGSSAPIITRLTGPPLGQLPKSGSAKVTHRTTVPNRGRRRPGVRTDRHLGALALLRLIGKTGSRYL